jgi:hypothetical protein
MPFWYNVASEGSKFNSVACTDWNQINSMVTFDEVAVKSDDEFYYFFGWASNVTDVIKVGEKNFNWEPQLLTLKIARKNYQKYDRNLKKKVDAEQSTVEKLICKLVETYDLSKVYKTAIQVQNSNLVKMLADGVDTVGNPMSKELYDQMSGSYLTMTEVLQPIHIKPDELQLPSKGNWGGSKGGQSESERLADRMLFINQQVKLAFPGIEISSVADICATLESTPGMAVLWDIISQLIK